MGTKTLTITLTQQLDCGCGDALLWLHDPTKLASNVGSDPLFVHRFIPVTIASTTVINSSSVEYELEYDDSYLATPSIGLTACDIKKLCCLGCGEEYLKEQLYNGVFFPMALVNYVPFFEGEGVVGAGSFNPEVRTPTTSGNGVDRWEFEIPGNISIPAAPFKAPTGFRWQGVGHLRVALRSSVSETLSGPTGFGTYVSLGAGDSGADTFAISGVGGSNEERSNHVIIPGSEARVMMSHPVFFGLNAYGEDETASKLVVQVVLADSVTDRPVINFDLGQLAAGMILARAL